ncbi:DnaT-like ssDNA-binding domain-containing protein [Alteromonas facilis]|uniref:DnaT-like ssDNA-binding domain-containing protein n=1 Tax=Alteromonas facilis TaxID=2048004 RepID=UPI000C2812D8|nr:DnaT-like ssDNA-binding domain-containing protein [Alteromonas facilis]
MNNAELNALTQAISNHARVLYMLGLRIDVNPHTGATQPLSYKSLMELLNASEQMFSRGRQINTLIKELIKNGLVNVAPDVDLEKSLNNQRLVLPLVPMNESDINQLHNKRTAITADWSPNKDIFEQLSHLVGLIDKECTDDEIGDFVAYWLGRPEIELSEFQWNQKFVSNLKQKRLARQSPTQKKVGSQTVTSKSALEVDDNARKLVEKYASKQ